MRIEHQHGADEAVRYGKLVGIAPDDVLLDIGANCGEVSRLWAEHGARAVAVEPNVELFPVLVAIPGVHAISAAVVGDKRAVVTYRSTRKSIFAYIEDPSVGSPPPGRPVGAVYEVPALNFDELLAAHRPTVVKVDVEGSEYLFADSFPAMPPHVRALTLEWHGFNQEQCDSANHHDRAMLAAGWIGRGRRLRSSFGCAVRAYLR